MCLGVCAYTVFVMAPTLTLIIFFNISVLFLRRKLNTQGKALSADQCVGMCLVGAERSQKDTA